MQGEGHSRGEVSATVKTQEGMIAHCGGYEACGECEAHSGCEDHSEYEACGANVSWVV